MRVRVPFGRRHLIGILIGVSHSSAVPQAKLKPALEIVDHRAVFDPVTFDLLRWAADYYHHPIGEVMAAALPASLRAGQPAQAAVESWTVSEAGRERLGDRAGRRAPRQHALLEWLAARGAATAHEADGFKPAHFAGLGETRLDRRAKRARRNPRRSNRVPARSRSATPRHGWSRRSAHPWAASPRICCTA